MQRCHVIFGFLRLFLITAVVALHITNCSRFWLIIDFNYCCCYLLLPTSCYEDTLSYTLFWQNTSVIIKTSAMNCLSDSLSIDGNDYRLKSFLFSKTFSFPPCGIARPKFKRRQIPLRSLPPPLPFRPSPFSFPPFP